MSTKSLTGSRFQACMKFGRPRMIIDMRPLPRLDFVGYSRDAAFEDFRAHGVKYVMTAMPSEDAPPMTVLHAFEQAGMTRQNLSDMVAFVLVDDDREASALAGYFQDLFAAIGWTGLEVSKDATREDE